jgi:hypothetical protein
MPLAELLASIPSANSTRSQPPCLPATSDGAFPSEGAVQGALPRPPSNAKPAILPCEGSEMAAPSPVIWHNLPIPVPSIKQHEGVAHQHHDQHRNHQF